MYADLNLARKAGANTVRIDVGWSSVEGSRPGARSRWYVKKLDAFMHGARLRGLGVIATVQSTPCWASSAPVQVRQGCRGDWWDGDVPWYPPRQPYFYANFVRWLTARYPRALTAVEIWNEPDQYQQLYWRAANPAREYAELVRATYGAAKQGNPHVTVLAGAMAGADLRFLRSLYRYGIRGHYDGLSLHSYCQPKAPNSRPRGAEVRWEFANGLRAFRRTQRRAGDAAPLWITEFGWPTGRGWAEVSLHKQATYTARAFHIAGSINFVRSAIVYALRDDGSDPSAWMDNLGLVTQSGRPKPAYYAVASTLRPRATSSRAVRRR